ncbi:hypothetical protein [Nocardioides alcanivorans]|uniref:hypothetical protein n=1 Tax=Nocardioides alcanivorans TaxID=2897352 RepID=UPI001F492562|nr:hypothetical protein [Nocardioides alcanivorans]
MGIFSRLGASLVPALNSGVWALVFLEDRSGPNLLIVPMLMAAVAVGLRRPLLGVLVLGATGAFAVLIGLSYGELELFVGCLVVLGWAGRYAISVWVGILGVALVAGSASLRDGFTLRKLVVSTFVFGSVWLFGRLVRHRAIAAARAIEEAEELAHTDPRALAHPRTADERRRVADGAARNLRVAVHDMVTAIDAILSDHAPDLAAVRRVRERGARTVEELRNLLVILRAEPAPTLGSAPPPRTRCASTWPWLLSLRPSHSWACGGSTAGRATMGCHSPTRAWSRRSRSAVRRRWSPVRSSPSQRSPWRWSRPRTPSRCSSSRLAMRLSVGS